MNTSYVIFCSLTSFTRSSIPTNVTTIRTITVKFVASFILEAVFAAFVHTVLTKRTIAASCKVTQRTKHRCFQIYIHFSFKKVFCARLISKKASNFRIFFNLNLKCRKKSYSIYLQVKHFEPVHPLLQPFWQIPLTISHVSFSKQ